ncbi:MAG: GntR family transcriptional regulator [Candidatus Dormibacteria bacterium]
MTATVPRSLVKPSSLSAQAKHALRARIITGEIGVDQIYSVPSLAASFGVSATPVREAMVELVSDGLVEVVANQGFRVVQLTEHDLDEIFQVRLMLEVAGMVEVARHSIGARVMKRYALIARQIEKCADTDDEVGFIQTDRAFHLGLLGCLGNTRLVDIVARLRDQTRLYGVPALGKRGELHHTAREHAELVTAVEAQDLDLVASTVKRHLEHTRGIWANAAGSELR